MNFVHILIITVQGSLNFQISLGEVSRNLVGESVLWGVFLELLIRSTWAFKPRVNICDSNLSVTDISRDIDMQGEPWIISMERALGSMLVRDNIWLWQRQSHISYLTREQSFFFLRARRVTAFLSFLNFFRLGHLLDNALFSSPLLALVLLFELVYRHVCVSNKSLLRLLSGPSSSHESRSTALFVDERIV